MRLKRKWRQEEQKCRRKMKENSAWFLPGLCVRGVVYGLKVKGQNI